jgi:hypothetical protein
MSFLCSVVITLQLYFERILSSTHQHLYSLQMIKGQSESNEEWYSLQKPCGREVSFRLALVRMKLQ